MVFMRNENQTRDGNIGKTTINVGSTSTITTSAVGGYGILNRMEGFVRGVLSGSHI